MSSRFTPHTLAETLRDIFRAETSGRLILIGDGGEEVRFHLARGLIDLAVTVGAHVAFLAQLAAQGLLRAPVPARFRREPPTPADLRAMQPTGAENDEVLRAVRAQSITAVENAFRIHAGSWQFEDQAEEGAFDANVPFTLELLLRGIAAIERWAPVHRVLAGQRRALRPAAVPLFPIDRLPLAAHEGFLLSRMDGHTTYSELSSLLPGVEQDQVARFVYSALVLGFVEFDPPLAEPFQLAAYAEKDREDRHREEKELEAIDTAYATLKTKNPYLILGLTDGAGWDEIRQSYDERKASLRSDRFLPSVRARRKDELQIIEGGLVEALLKIQSLRLDAVGKRSRDRATAEAPVTDLNDLARRRMDSLKTDRQEVLEQHEKSAAIYLAKARESFREGDFHNTVEFCNLANQHRDDNPESYALLGEALSKNPARRWQLRAEAAFKKAIELDPWNPTHYLRMGEFYRRQGMEQKASRFFEKAYGISPSLRPGAAGGDRR